MGTAAHPIAVNVATGALEYPAGTYASAPDADDQGLKAWAFDPANLANGVAVSAGFLYLTKLVLPAPATISKLWTIISTAGETLTEDQNFLVAYNAAGARVGVTADQTAAFASAQLLGAALTAPYAAPAGPLYVGVLANGGTPPTLLSGTLLNKSSRSVGNVGIAAAADGFRFGFYGSSLTETPATITVASIDPNIGATLWMAVS